MFIITISIIVTLHFRYSHSPIAVKMMSAENQHAELQDLAHKPRIHSVKMTQASNSGHPTSCSSMAEIMSVSVTKNII